MSTVMAPGSIIERPVNRESLGIMSDNAPRADWWLASDGNWYPPEARPIQRAGSRTHGRVNVRAAWSVLVPAIGWGLVQALATTFPFFAVAAFDGLVGSVGLFLAITARAQIRSSSGGQTGGWLAVTGLILSSMTILSAVLGLAIGLLWNSSSLTF